MFSICARVCEGLNSAFGAYAPAGIEGLVIAMSLTSCDLVCGGARLFALSRTYVVISSLAENNSRSYLFNGNPVLSDIVPVSLGFSIFRVTACSNSSVVSLSVVIASWNSR